MNTLLIGFGNKARHGKDFMASKVHALLPEQTRLYSFGNALKCWARVQGWMEKKDGPLLQLLGTDLFRHQVDPDIWVRCLQYQIEEEAPAVALITDVRFPNEANWIRDNGGRLYRITRLNHDGTPFVAQDRPADHPSEIALDDYTFDHDFVATSGHIEMLADYAKLISNWIVDRSL